MYLLRNIRKVMKTQQRCWNTCWAAGDTDNSVKQQLLLLLYCAKKRRIFLHMGPAIGEFLLICFRAPTS